MLNKKKCSSISRWALYSKKPQKGKQLSLSSVHLVPSADNIPIAQAAAEKNQKLSTTDVMKV